jgi:negative regulator of sigma E activity
MGGAILPLLYYFQNVEGLKPVASLLRIVPMVVAAAVVLAVSSGARAAARATDASSSAASPSWPPAV